METPNTRTNQILTVGAPSFNVQINAKLFANQFPYIQLDKEYEDLPIENGISERTCLGRATQEQIPYRISKGAGLTFRLETDTSGRTS